MTIIEYLKKDWPMLPITIFILAGYAWCIVDISSPDRVRFHLTLELIGIFLFIIGSFLEILVRIELKNKANFPSLQSTKKLLIVEEHRLITDGLFKYIRHPLYIGRILLSLGVGLFCSSIYGLILISIGLAFIIPRIQIEEKMLIDKFGYAYREYQKKTKKLIPYIY